MLVVGLLEARRRELQLQLRFPVSVRLYHGIRVSSPKLRQDKAAAASPCPEKIQGEACANSFANPGRHKEADDNSQPHQQHKASNTRAGVFAAHGIGGRREPGAAGGQGTAAADGAEAGRRQASALETVGSALLSLVSLCPLNASFSFPLNRQNQLGLVFFCLFSFFFSFVIFFLFFLFFSRVLFFVA